MSEETKPAIETLCDPAPDAVRDLVRRRTPFVLRDREASRDRVADLESLLRAAGGIRVRLRHGGPLLHYTRHAERDETSLAEYVEQWVRAAQPDDDTQLSPYVANMPLGAEDCMRFGFDYPASFAMRKVDFIRLWLGPGGTCSPLHFDKLDSLLCLCFGHKRFWLYAPDQRRWLYHLKSAPTRSAVVDPRSADLSRFPDLARARRVELELSPGDAIYLPAGWSHFVENLDATLMVAYWLRRRGMARLLGIAANWITLGGRFGTSPSVVRR
jgi:Cupin-like domain